MNTPLKAPSSILTTYIYIQSDSVTSIAMQRPPKVLGASDVIAATQRIRHPL
jgi:hypothetical protein